MHHPIDISEDYLKGLGHGILEQLLKDHTTGKNIIWATDDYAYLGEGYSFFDEITIEKITGKYNHLIKPRISKEKDNQRERSRNRAEVFTPSWICNAQNNLIDNAWFGREGVFNTENPDHTWTVNTEPITFPKGKKWHDYVKANRLEITCGEAPYLASRYDTVTGEIIPVNNRIGLFDRKMRVVHENTKAKKGDETATWREWAIKAYQSTYGFEWQGDNLLLARKSLLVSYREYFFAKWNREPQDTALKKIAEVISWNIWQMDGIQYGIPGRTPNEPHPGTQLKIQDSEQDPNLKFCRIKEWTNHEPLKGNEVKFIDLINKK